MLRKTVLNAAEATHRYNSITSTITTLEMLKAEYIWICTRVVEDHQKEINLVYNLTVHLVTNVVSNNQLHAQIILPFFLLGAYASRNIHTYIACLFAYAFQMRDTEDYVAPTIMKDLVDILFLMSLERDQNDLLNTFILDPLKETIYAKELQSGFSHLPLQGTVKVPPIRHQIEYDYLVGCIDAVIKVMLNRMFTQTFNEANILSKMDNDVFYSEVVCSIKNTSQLTCSFFDELIRKFPDPTSEQQLILSLTIDKSNDGLLFGRIWLSIIRKNLCAFWYSLLQLQKRLELFDDLNQFKSIISNLVPTTSKNVGLEMCLISIEQHGINLKD
jgi:hypothetical protein